MAKGDRRGVEDMVSVLFDGVHKITNEDVVERANYYIDKAEGVSKIFSEDRKQGVELARELRNSLKKEYKNNDLIRIGKLYKDDPVLFRAFKISVHRASVSVTGQLTDRNVTSFLYDVKDYMCIYYPEDK